MVSPEPTCGGLVVLEDGGAAVREPARPAGAAAQHARGRLEAAVVASSAAAAAVPESDGVRRRRRLPSGGGRHRGGVGTTAENVVLGRETREAHSDTEGPQG